MRVIEHHRLFPGKIEPRLIGQTLARFQLHRARERIVALAHQALAQHPLLGFGTGQQDEIERRDPRDEAARPVAKTMRGIDQPRPFCPQPAQCGHAVLHGEDGVIPVQLCHIVAHRQILEHAEDADALQGTGEQAAAQAMLRNRRRAIGRADALKMMGRFRIIIQIDHLPAWAGRQFERNRPAMIALIGFCDIEEGDSHAAFHSA